MRANLKIGMALLGLIYLSAALPQRSALAITADVAKKCSALSEKAYPPRVVGNPAAGRQNGSFLDFRNYFNKCVANGGNPPEQEHQQPNQSPEPGKDRNNEPPKQSQ